SPVGFTPEKTRATLPSLRANDSNRSTLHTGYLTSSLRRRNRLLVTSQAKPFDHDRASRRRRDPDRDRGRSADVARARHEDQPPRSERRRVRRERAEIGLAAPNSNRSTAVADRDDEIDPPPLGVR